MEQKKATCDFCNLRCGILVTVDDNENIIHVEGDPSSQRGFGYVCERALALPEFHDHPRRLNYPMKRVGKRGENKWMRITWDEALDEIAAKIMEIKKDYGPEAIGSLGGTMHGQTDEGRFRFLNKLGSPNGLCQGRNCGGVAVAVSFPMFGWDTMNDGPVVGVTKTFIIPGANPPESSPAAWSYYKMCQAQGTRMICIDPRRTETAAQADLWLQVRPGTDAALFWGMISYIIEKDLVNHEFIDNWTVGYDRVLEEAKNWSVERASEITTVPVDDIVKAAEWWADGPSIMSFGLTSCHLGPAAAPTHHASQLLIAIMGYIDVLGGHSLMGPAHILDYYNLLAWDELIDNPDRTRDCLTADKFFHGVKTLKRAVEVARGYWGEPFPMAPYLECPSPRGFIDAILDEEPYPIKALILDSVNNLGCLTGGKRAAEAMRSEKLELSVGMDFFMTPSMALCDYVLPAQDFSEKNFLATAWGWGHQSDAHRRVVKPLCERKDDYWIWKELAKRCGQTDWPDSLEEWYDALLKTSNITWAELADQDGHGWIASDDQHVSFEPDRYKRKGGFGTISGKVEMVVGMFEEADMDPFPTYCEPGQSPVSDPELAEEYPFTMIAGHRIRHYHHTEMRELNSLRSRQLYPFVEINTATARSLGIGEDDWVWIETPLGRVRQKAKLTYGVAPNTVAAEAYWYYPEMPVEDPWLMGVSESNANWVMPDGYELCSFNGDQPMRVVACKIYRAESGVDTNPKNIEWETPECELGKPFAW